MKTINTTYINFAKRLAVIVLLCTIGTGMVKTAAETYVKYRTLCPYIITWSVAGEEYTEGDPTVEVYPNQPTKKITALPTPPTAVLVGCCADEFVGWTRSTSQSINQNDILSDAELLALDVNSSMEFYAVFSKAGGNGYVTDCDIKDYVCGEITVNSNPVVTSTAGQKVKVNVPITLTSQLGIPTTITGSSDNTAFTVDPLENITAGDYFLTIHYTPTATTDGIETANITLTASAGNNATTTFQVKGRHLPQNFVIAAKAGNEYVALTANVSNAKTQLAVPIKVDNKENPTKATVALNTTQYQLLGLKTNNRYTANGTAVHFYSTKTEKVLSASTGNNTKTSLNTDANHQNAETSDNAPFYEWQLVTTDLVHYTVTNSNTQNKDNLILGHSSTSGEWGMYQSSNAINQEIVLLGIQTTLTEVDIEVMEWGTNSMVLRFAATAPAKINVSVGNVTNTNQKPINLYSENASDIYKVENLSGLTSNDCETMEISYDGQGTLIRKPILVSGEQEGSNYTTSPTREVCEHCDIVILNGGKLTANEAKSTGSHVDFANIYVYPGGTLVLDGNSLGVKQQVYLRGGYSWLNQATHALPEVYLNGDINFNGSGNIIYDYYIQNSKYYQFALPYTVPLANVKDEAGFDNFPVWVKHYNGALRANDRFATSWDWYYGDNFERGIGYIIAARPRQVDKVKNRPLSIIRFPLGNKAFTATNGMETALEVSTTAHGIDGYKAGTVTANNVGWNFVGNPFLSTWKGTIGHKQLQLNIVEEKWDGTYRWVESDTKYITIMSAESGSDYKQYVASTTELKPFFPFFMQETAAGGSGTINFATGNRVKKAPAAMLADEPREAFVQLEITIDDAVDQTGIFISDKYSDAIDFDDYEKMFGSASDKAKLWLVHEEQRMAFEAVTEGRAGNYLQLGYRAPQAAEYTLAINEEVSQMDEIEAVYLTDYEAEVYDHDLISEAYVFDSQSTLYNDTRFDIRIVLKAENQGNVSTYLENLNIHSSQPQKFIYNGRLYILRDGKVYNAAGHEITTINEE